MTLAVHGAVRSGARPDARLGFFGLRRLALTTTNDGPKIRIHQPTRRAPFSSNDWSEEGHHQVNSAGPSARRRRAAIPDADGSRDGRQARVAIAGARRHDDGDDDDDDDGEAEPRDTMTRAPSRTARACLAGGPSSGSTTRFADGWARTRGLLAIGIRLDLTR